MKTIKQIKQAHKKLEDMPLITDADYHTFYSAQSAFCELLNSFMHENKGWALELTRNDLIYFLSLCSKYRPKNPHSILTLMSIQLDRLNELNASKKRGTK